MLPSKTVCIIYLKRRQIFQKLWRPQPLGSSGHQANCIRHDGTLCSISGTWRVKTSGSLTPPVCQSNCGNINDVKKVISYCSPSTNVSFFVTRMTTTITGYPPRLHWCVQLQPAEHLSLRPAEADSFTSTNNMNTYSDFTKITLHTRILNKFQPSLWHTSITWNVMLVCCTTTSNKHNNNPQNNKIKFYTRFMDKLFIKFAGNKHNVKLIPNHLNIADQNF